MTLIAPPETPRPDELEALIREARARQRKRWLTAAVVVACLAGGVLAVYSIANGGSAAVSQTNLPTAPAKNGRECRIRVVGPRIIGPGGSTVYREPAPSGERHPNGIPSQVRCNSSAVWVVWFNGAGMMQEAYVGARSVDHGRTWKLVFSERFFGVKAPHELDSYMGPWILRGRVAYFTGSCPACSSTTSVGTVSLWVTKDAGRTFRMYRVPALTGYAPVRLRVRGRNVRIWAKRFARGVKPHKTVTVRVA